MRSLVRRGLAATVAASLALGAPGASAGLLEDEAIGRELSPVELVMVFDEAVLPGLQPIGDPPSITGDAALDERIRAIAEMRGYVRRSEPSEPLVAVDGRFLQADAAAGWEALQAAAAAAGHTITLTSGYRSAASQASIFRSRIGGTSDAAIDSVLRTVAAPGYSKHHTGYAVDMRSGPFVLYDFANSPAYAWLSADNWANARSFGWLPSYPDGVDDLGPNPEPWEFVWVGATNIVCMGFEPTDEAPFCDTLGSSFEADIVWLHDEALTTGCHPVRFCTEDDVTRGEAATFLWRLFDRPEPDGDSGFDDVPDGAFFDDPVAWMVDESITTGTSPTMFSPFDDLTRAQFVTFLWRAAGRPDGAPPHEFADVEPGHFSEDAVSWAAANGITRGTSPSTFGTDESATRGQIAAFLHRYADLLAA